MIVYLKEHFSSAHLYKQSQWDAAENLKHFGRCFNEFGHGHNYTVEVGFHIDEVDFEQTKQKYALVLKEICQKLDHEHLNFSVPEFKTHIPTTENIAIYFHEKLKNQISETKIALIRLYEMNDLWTEIRL